MKEQLLETRRQVAEQHPSLSCHLPPSEVSRVYILLPTQSLMQCSPAGSSKSCKKSTLTQKSTCGNTVDSCCFALSHGKLQAPEMKCPLG